MNTELKICVQSADWYDELFNGDERAEEAFRFIRECGFDTLDYNIDHTLPGGQIVNGTLNDFYDADIDTLIERYRPLKETMERNGISFGQAHAPFPLYVDGADAVNDYMIQVVEKECAICKYLDCPALVVHPYSCEDREKEKEINLSMYRKMISAGKKYGVKLCLENCYQYEDGHVAPGVCRDAEEACWYIDTLNKEAGEEVFGYCLDVGHVNLFDRDLRKEIQTLGHRLTILHIHENDGNHDYHLIPYTQRAEEMKTCIDWENFLEGLRDIKYKGVLSFETFGSLKHVPQELIPALLKLTYEVGCYFKKRIEE